MAEPKQMKTVENSDSELEIEEKEASMEVSNAAWLAKNSEKIVNVPKKSGKNESSRIPVSRKRKQNALGSLELQQPEDRIEPSDTEPQDLVSEIEPSAMPSTARHRKKRLGASDSKESVKKPEQEVANTVEQRKRMLPSEVQEQADKVKSSRAPARGRPKKKGLASSVSKDSEIEIEPEVPDTAAPKKKLATSELQDPMNKVEPSYATARGRSKKKVLAASESKDLENGVKPEVPDGIEPKRRLATAELGASADKVGPSNATARGRSKKKGLTSSDSKDSVHGDEPEVYDIAAPRKKKLVTSELQDPVDKVGPPHTTARGRPKKKGLVSSDSKDSLNGAEPEASDTSEQKKMVTSVLRGTADRVGPSQAAATGRRRKKGSVASELQDPGVESKPLDAPTMTKSYRKKAVAVSGSQKSENQNMVTKQGSKVQPLEDATPVVTSKTRRVPKQQTHPSEALHVPAAKKTKVGALTALELLLSSDDESSEMGQKQTEDDQLSDTSSLLATKSKKLYSKRTAPLNAEPLNSVKPHTVTKGKTKIQKQPDSVISSELVNVPSKRKAKNDGVGKLKADVPGHMATQLKEGKETASAEIKKLAKQDTDSTSMNKLRNVQRPALKPKKGTLDLSESLDPEKDKKQRVDSEISGLTKDDKKAKIPQQGQSSVNVQGRKFVGAHVSIVGGLENSVTEAVSMGARAFGLFLRSQRQWTSKPLTQEAVDKFQLACRQHSFSPDVILPHGSYLLNCGAPNENTLQKSRNTLIDELSRCEMLGLSLYNFHPGSTCGKISIEECLDRIAETINLAHSKTKFVVTVLENMSKQGHTVGGDFQELKGIIDRVTDKSRVGVCLDTCHAFAAGYDLSKEEGFQSMMEDFERIVGLKYLKAVHLNDSEGELGSRSVQEACIGKGHIGLDGFRRIMNDPCFDGIPMILQTPDQVDDAEEIKLLYGLCE